MSTKSEKLKGRLQMLKKIIDNVTPEQIINLRWTLEHYDYDDLTNDLMKLEVENNALSEVMDSKTKKLMSTLIQCYEEAKKTHIKSRGYINPRLFEDSAFTNQD